MARGAQQTKMCILCHEVKPLEEFYKNRAWHEQRFCDAYCKECAKQMAQDKESIRRYFWDNNRLWNDEIWEAAKKKAAYTLATSEEFLKKNVSRERRQAAENKAIALACLQVMNSTTYYGYSDNVSEEAESVEFDPDSDAGTVVTSEDGTLSYANEAKVYSTTWNGKYTKAEIDYMERYYQSLTDTFDVTDIAKEDSFRKCAKASLLYDRVQNAYREGKATMSEVRAAQSMFDDNLKSANLAACTRKEKTQGVMSLGSIVEMIENEGLLQTTQVEFPEDDIDRILEDFAHTAVAIGEVEE